MNDQVNKQYIQRRQNRQQNLCHWRLGIQQMIQKPVFIMPVFLIIALAVFGWLKIEDIVTMLDVSKIFFPMYFVTMKLLGIILPILLIWGMIDFIGTLTARKEEANLSLAFEEKDLRNGSPILMYKRKEKNTGVTVRKWYTTISMAVWTKRQNEISDALNITILEVSYGLNAQQIVTRSLKGRETIRKRNTIYDMDLEGDMQKYEDRI